VHGASAWASKRDGDHAHGTSGSENSGRALQLTALTAASWRRSSVHNFTSLTILVLTNCQCKDVVPTDQLG